MGTSGQKPAAVYEKRKKGAGEQAGGRARRSRAELTDGRAGAQQREREKPQKSEWMKETPEPPACVSWSLLPLMLLEGVLATLILWRTLHQLKWQSHPRRVVFHAVRTMCPTRGAAFDV